VKSSMIQCVLTLYKRDRLLMRRSSDMFFMTKMTVMMTNTPIVTSARQVAMLIGLNLGSISISIAVK